MADSELQYTYDAKAINLVHEQSGALGEFGLALRILPQAKNPDLSVKIERARQLISETDPRSSADLTSWVADFGHRMGQILDSPDIGTTTTTHLSLYFGELGSLASRAISGGEHSSQALSSARILCQKSLEAQSAFISRATFECVQLLAQQEFDPETEFFTRPSAIAFALRNWSDCVTAAGGGKLAASASAQLIGNLCRFIPSLRNPWDGKHAGLLPISVKTLRALGHEIGDAFAQRSFEMATASVMTSPEIEQASCAAGDHFELVFLSAAARLGWPFSPKASLRTLENTSKISLDNPKMKVLQTLPSCDFGLAWGMALAGTDGGLVPLDLHANFFSAIRVANDNCPADSRLLWSNQIRRDECSRWLEDTIEDLRRACCNPHSRQIQNVLRSYWGTAGDLAAKAMAGAIGADARLEWAVAQNHQEGSTQFKRAAICRATNIALDMLDQDQWSPAAFEKATMGWAFVANVVFSDKDFSFVAFRDLFQKMGKREAGRPQGFGPSIAAIELFTRSFTKALSHDPNLRNEMRKDLFDALVATRSLVHTENGRQHPAAKPKDADASTINAKLASLTAFTQIAVQKTSGPNTLYAQRILGTIKKQQP